MRSLNHHGLFQLFGEAVETAGEAIDIEIQRVVVTVRDLGVDGGVERRNEPLAAAYAGNRIKERQPVVLRRSKGGIGRLRVVAPAVAGRAAARLDNSLCRKRPCNAPPNSAACSNLVSRQAIE